MICTGAVKHQVAHLCRCVTDVGADGPQGVEVSFDDRRFEREVEEPCAVEADVTGRCGLKDHQASVGPDEERGDAVDARRMRKSGHGCVGLVKCVTNAHAEIADDVPGGLQVGAEGPHTAFPVCAQREDVEARTVKVQQDGTFQGRCVEMAPRLHGGEHAIFEDRHDL